MAAHRGRGSRLWFPDDRGDKSAEGQADWHARSMGQPRRFEIGQRVPLERKPLSLGPIFTGSGTPSFKPSRKPNRGPGK